MAEPGGECIRPNPPSIENLLAMGTEQIAGSSPTPQLDAEVLLCHCLDKARSFLRAWPELRPHPEQIQRYRALIAQRAQGHPIAHLTGQREFWSRDFIVTADVLIPRPDTELLVELALELLPADRPAKLIDLGTGSGILAITLASERPRSEVLACDYSPAALAVAKANAERLQTRNLRFIHSHWFEQVADKDFDLAVSNPPYIAEDDPHLNQGDVAFEPRAALVSPEQGLKDIDLITDQAREHLKPGGHLLIEHGYNQGPAVQAIFAARGFDEIATRNDLSGNPRVTSGIWNPA